MRVSSGYRYVNLNDASYVPKYSRMDAVVSKCTRVCIPCSIHIKKAEKILHDYNEERYKLAFLFYKVAEYAKKMATKKTATKRTATKNTDKNGNIKGITLDSKIEDCTVKIKNIRAGMAELGNLLKKRAHYTIAGAIFMNVAFVLFYVVGVVGLATGTIGNFVADDPNIAFYVPGIGLLFLVLFSIIMPTTALLGYSEVVLSGRLKYAFNEQCVDYFDTMCKRLEYMGCKHGKFTYGIKKGNLADENLVYYFAGLIHSTNEYRSFMHKQFPSYRYISDEGFI